MDNETPASDAYDTPWKDAITRYFPEFMAFYFPLAHAEIDWRQAHVFLDQELAQIVQDAELGKRLVDRLVQVSTRDGGEQWVYIHVEVQGQHDANFPERLFTYNYRLYDRYRRPVATLAVLADDGENWKPTHFGYRLFGCEMGIRFPTVKLLDYADQVEALLADTNPFALVTAAHLFTRKTKGDPEQRYADMTALTDAFDHPENADLTILQQQGSSSMAGTSIEQRQVLKGVLIAVGIIGGLIVLALILQYFQN